MRIGESTTDAYSLVLTRTVATRSSDAERQRRVACRYLLRRSEDRNQVINTMAIIQVRASGMFHECSSSLYF